MVYDVSSPNYVPKQYIDIITEILNLAQADNLISDDSSFLQQIANGESIENTMVLDFSKIAQMLALVYDDLTLVHNENDIDEAVGYVLDNRLKLFITRYPPGYAIGMATFYVNTPLNYNIDIPAGTDVGTSQAVPVQFKTTQDMVYLANTNSIDAPVECTTIGPIGNILAGQLDTIINGITGIDGVTNNLNYTGGANPESDAQYLSRGYMWKFSQRKGNYDAFVDALYGVTALAGYNIQPFWRGYGTTLIIYDPPIPPVYDLVVSAVRSVAEVDEDITIQPVQLVPINVDETVNISLGDTIAYTPDQESQILANCNTYLAAYIDGGYNADGTLKLGMRIGQDFIPFQANAYIMSQVPEVQYFDIIYPQTDAITIGPNQKATMGVINMSLG